MPPVLRPPPSTPSLHKSFSKSALLVPLPPLPDCQSPLSGVHHLLLHLTRDRDGASLGSGTEGRGGLSGGRALHFRPSTTLHPGPYMQTFCSDQVQEDMWLIYEETHNSRERPVPRAPIMEPCGGKSERHFLLEVSLSRQGSPLGQSLTLPPADSSLSCLPLYHPSFSSFPWKAMVG